MNDCPFCELDPAFVGETLASNAHCLYLRRDERVLQGSGLIVPRAHRETVFDLTPDEWAATGELLAEAKTLVDEQLRPDGYNVGWNARETGGQWIPHCHLHVIPRFRDEPHAGRGIRWWLKQDENLRPGRGRAQPECTMRRAPPGGDREHR